MGLGILKAADEKLAGATSRSLLPGPAFTGIGVRRIPRAFPL